MRYHHDKPSSYTSMYGRNYICNHPVYNICTLFEIGEKGLAIIQQRFIAENKTTYWGCIDPWLNDELYLHPNFLDYFEEMADLNKNGLYPTVTIRQIMWALKMKPIKREQWETVFDRKNV